VEALVDYIYMTLCLNLDYIIPFAAVLENGQEIDGLDDKSELTHCKVDLAAALEFDDF
jgi:fatty acid synthase subunit alpha, fungi type